MPAFSGTIPKTTPATCKVKICPYYLYPKNLIPTVCDGCKHQRK